MGSVRKNSLSSEVGSGRVGRHKRLQEGLVTLAHACDLKLGGSTSLGGSAAISIHLLTDSSEKTGEILIWIETLFGFGLVKLK